MVRAHVRAPTGAARASDTGSATLSAVVLAEPAAIVEQSPKGGHDLYVALTCVTRRLTVVHERELPMALR